MNLDSQVEVLREQAKQLMNMVPGSQLKGPSSASGIPEAFRRAFFRLIDQVNLSLMEDTHNFFGYFLFQMSRDLRFDISSPTAVNYKGAKYVIYFNPVLFLRLNLKQMECTIKHEILHIVSLHLTRAKELKGKYSPLALNIAMDIVVNKYLDYLPPYATTLEWINAKYDLHLEPYAPFEYYAEKLQTLLDLLDEEDEEEPETDPEDEEAPETDPEDEKKPETDPADSESTEVEYDPARMHDIWEESSEIDAATLAEFTEKAVRDSEKGAVPTYLIGILTNLKNRKGELPWNLYLHQLMGTVESNKKKTVTRKNRRQPDRLDLRGELRSHIAKIAVAVDISASISDEEFLQAMKEVLTIVKNYNHEITVIECDDRIRHVYPVKTVKDLKERPNTRGGTRFTPVFEYANEQDYNLLVYFTDGKGESRLKVTPAGYRVLWIISGRGEQLSLQEPYGAVKKLNRIEVKDTILDQYDVQQGGFSMNHQESSV
jgi:predicted metal-dependent peptidase